MTTDAYQSISEIYREDDGEFVPPLEEWEIEVLDTDVSAEFGDIGGRELFRANARVQVTEPDGTTWTGLVYLD